MQPLFIFLKAEHETSSVYKMPVDLRMGMRDRLPHMRTKCMFPKQPQSWIRRGEYGKDRACYFDLALFKMGLLYTTLKWLCTSKLDFSKIIPREL